MNISNIYEAKAKLSEIINAVLRGEKWVIAKNGQPLVMLVPIQQAKKKLRLGAFKKKIKVADDFDAPLAPEEIKSWYS